MPGDWLAREDEVLTYVVFIDTGLVEVLVDEQHVAEMGDGSYLGEISALGLGGEAGRGLGLATASVKARDVCSIHARAHGSKPRRLRGATPVRACGARLARAPAAALRTHQTRAHTRAARPPSQPRGRGCAPS